MKKRFLIIGISLDTGTGVEDGDYFSVHKRIKIRSDNFPYSTLNFKVGK